MLALAIAAGVGVYLLYHAWPALHPAGPVLKVLAAWVQPLLLSVMLFLSLCRVSPRDIRPHRWQIRPLLLQCGVFIALCLLLIAARHCSGAFWRWISAHELIVQAALLCFITPTANSSVVVVGKLGGALSFGGGRFRPVETGIPAFDGAARDRGTGTAGNNDADMAGDRHTRRGDDHR